MAKFPITKPLTVTAEQVKANALICRLKVKKLSIWRFVKSPHLLVAGKS